MKPLLDEIAKAIYNYLGYPPSDGGMTAEYKGAAQAAIDVVERRLSEVKIEAILESLDFEESTATFSVPAHCRWFSGEYFIINKKAWQAVKGTDNAR